MQPPQPSSLPFRNERERSTTEPADLSRGAVRDEAAQGSHRSGGLEYYAIMQEMFNGYFSSPAYAGKDFKTVVADHEDKLAKMLDLMLYGIAERGSEK